MKIFLIVVGNYESETLEQTLGGNLIRVSLNLNPGQRRNVRDTGELVCDNAAKGGR